MSISTQITRITELRDRLRTKLTAMGLATSTSKLEDLTEAVEDITTQGAQTYTPGTTNQTVAAGQYLTGAQTISGDANLTAENIADGVSIFGVAGTHMGGTDTTDATMTSGGQMLSGVTAYSNGTKYTGIIATKSITDLTSSDNTVTVPAGYYASQVTKTVGTAKAAATYYPGTSDQSIASGTYTTGAQTIKAVTTTNLSASNIMTGVTVEVGDSADSDRVASVTGTFTSDGTVTSNAQILSGYVAYSKGAKYTGSIASKSASDLTASGATVTVPAGYYSAQATKSVATTTHPNPTVSVNSTTGVITASHTQTAGYVSAGTTTGTAQLTVYDGTVEGGA